MADKSADVSTNLARAFFEQGLGMGWGDEAEALARSKRKGSPGYEAELANLRKEYAQFSKEHGFLAPAAEFTGAAVPAAVSYLMTVGTGGAAAPSAAATTARAAGALGRLASSVRSAFANPYVAGGVSGLTQGAITGAGSAEPGERTSGAVTGGLLGGALGVATPAAMKGAAATWGWGRDRFFPNEEFVTRRAAAKINEALADAGMTPADAARKMAADQAMGLRPTLSDVSLPTTALAETVAQRGGKSPDIVESALGPRVKGTKERTYQRVRSDISSGDYFAERKDAVDDLRAKAKTVYDDAYFDPQGQARVVDDPSVQYVLTHPTFKDAYRRGKAIAETDAMAAKLRGEDPSRYVLPDIYESVPTGKRDPVTNAPIMTEKLTDALPTVQTLDYVKRGLDEIIDSAYSGSSSVGKGQAGGLKKLRDAMTAAIDNNIPEYRQARRTYAGDAEVINAMDTGFKQFQRMHPEEVSAFMEQASDAEKEAFKSGAVRSLFTKILGTSRKENAARNLIDNEVMRKRLEPLFDSPAQFDLFTAALQRDAQLHDNATKILGGAATARRLEGRQRFENEPGVGEAIADTVTGGWGGALSNWASRWMRRGAFTDEKAAKVAHMLMSSDPAEVAAAVQTLQRQGQKAATTGKVAGTAQVGTAGGLAGARVPAPPGEIDEENLQAPPPDYTDLRKEIEAQIAAEDEKAARLPGNSMVR
jgi:hypothetical protein